MILRRNCPICDKALPDDPKAAEKVSPFCSVRCKQIDLFRWTEGRYAIVDQLNPQEVELLQMGEDPESADPDAE